MFAYLLWNLGIVLLCYTKDRALSSIKKIGFCGTWALQQRAKVRRQEQLCFGEEQNMGYYWKEEGSNLAVSACSATEIPSTSQSFGDVSGLKQPQLGALEKWKEEWGLFWVATRWRGRDHKPELTVERWGILQEWEFQMRHGLSEKPLETGFRNMQYDRASPPVSTWLSPHSSFASLGGPVIKGGLSKGWTTSLLLLVHGSTDFLPAW